MSNNTKSNPPATEAAQPRQVQESRAVSINVKGGKMQGVFVKHATRYAEGDGKPYSGWILEQASGIVEDRKTKGPAAAAEGRYFVFSAQRLDRQMREVERGERVLIEYQGLEKNEPTETNPEGKGEHHTYMVTYK